MASHKRKPITEKEQGRYTKRDLASAVISVLRGDKDTHGAKSAFGPSIRTLNRYLKQVNDDVSLTCLADRERKVLEIILPSPVLPSNVERALADYINHRTEVCLPLSKSAVLVHLKDYTSWKGITIQHGKLGHEFFEQLCSDHKLELVHPYEVESFLNRPIDVETWMSQVKSHVVSVNTGLISGKKKVFIVEVQAFKTNTTPSRQISVVIIYNCCNEIIRWIIVTDGTVISMDFVQTHIRDVWLLKTTTGAVSSDTAMSALIAITRYISEENLSGNCLVLVDPFLARELDMNIWDFANTSNLIVYPIPRAVCSSMKTFNAGALTRYCTHMLLLISTRFIQPGYVCDEYQFVSLHFVVHINSYVKQCIAKTIRLLSLYKTVARTPRPPAPDPQSEEVTDPLPSHTETPPRRGRPKQKVGKKAVANRSCSESRGNVKNRTSTVDASTQTVLSVEPPETPEQERVEALKIRLDVCVDSIRGQDLDSSVDWEV